MRTIHYALNYVRVSKYVLVTFEGSISIRIAKQYKKRNEKKKEKKKRTKKKRKKSQKEQSLKTDNITSDHFPQTNNTT